MSWVLVGRRSNRWRLKSGLRWMAAKAHVARRRPGDPAVVVWSGRTTEPTVALTFDDNSHSELQATSAILKALTDARVPATLFVSANRIEESPEIYHRIANGGFEVGDHGCSHVNLHQLPRPVLVTEIGAGIRAFRSTTGHSTAPIFRPPFGAFDAEVAEVAGKAGLPYIVMWNVDSNDWQGHAPDILERDVLEQVTNGAIVLFHLFAQNTAEALPRIIEELRTRGYRFVTVTDMIESYRGRLELDERASLVRAYRHLRVRGGSLVSALTPKRST